METSKAKAGDLILGYKEFVRNAVLEVINALNGLGASRYEVSLMVTPLISKRFAGLDLPAETLDETLEELVKESKVYLTYHRYIRVLP